MDNMATTNWQYTTLCDENELNKYGLIGWELVAVIQSDNGTRFYMKKPAPSLREQATEEQKLKALQPKGEMEA
jgi:hypothetical protein